MVGATKLGATHAKPNFTFCKNRIFFLYRYKIKRCWNAVSTQDAVHLCVSVVREVQNTEFPGVQVVASLFFFFPGDPTYSKIDDAKTETYSVLRTNHGRALEKMDS